MDCFKVFNKAGAHALGPQCTFNEKTQKKVVYLPKGRIVGVHDAFKVNEPQSELEECGLPLIFNKCSCTSS